VRKGGGAEVCGVLLPAFAAGITCMNERLAASMRARHAFFHRIVPRALTQGRGAASVAGGRALLPRRGRSALFSQGVSAGRGNLSVRGLTAGTETLQHLFSFCHNSLSHMLSALALSSHHRAGWWRLGRAHEGQAGTKGAKRRSARIGAALALRTY